MICSGKLKYFVDVLRREVRLCEYRDEKRWDNPKNQFTGGDLHSEIIQSEIIRATGNVMFCNIAAAFDKVQ